MRLRLSPTAALLLFLVALAAACGSNGDGGDPAEGVIPTATLPSSLPDPIIVRGTPRPASGERYIVQSGDSPASIAAQFGIPVEDLIAANNIVDPTALYVGQELIIPGVDGGQVESEPTATDEPSVEVEPTATQERPEGQVYVVQAGDIPETIAERFGITADELMAANGITDPASLQIGQELIIPTPAE